MPDKILSILIPTIPSRKKRFNSLLRTVKKQIGYCTEYHSTLGLVEVVCDDSKEYLNGGPSIGEKRQNLLDRAEAKYLCYLDDDETISPAYVETLLRLCVHQDEPHVCTFRNISKFDNYWCIVDMSIKNKKNEQAHDQDIVRRLPWHICPVLSEFAKKHTFSNLNYGEDWKWFNKVLDHCWKENHTNAIIHQYNHSVKRSEATKITMI